MATRKQRAEAMRKHRAYLRIERQYYLFIRRLYVQWWNENVPKIFKVTGVRLKADEDLDYEPFEDLETSYENVVFKLNGMAQDFAFKVEENLYRFEQVAMEIDGETRLVDVPRLQDITLSPEVSRQLVGFVEENAKLVKNIGDETIDKLGMLTQNALTFGETPEELEEKIAKLGEEYAGYRARLIARDQVGKLQGKIAETKMKEAGIKKYEWMDVGDSRVRSSHKALNGTIRTWDQSPRPGEEIQCRCQAIAVLE
jgi:SPP1 gp7 family putative phage head morphogenesis protein